MSLDGRLVFRGLDCLGYGDTFDDSVIGYRSAKGDDHVDYALDDTSTNYLYEAV